jgi:UDP-2,3-diacylglucosamine pyrophosphatase LpxH
MRPVKGGIIRVQPAYPFMFKHGSVFGVTLISDVHIGAPNVDLALFKQDLKTAAEHDDRILINGDLWDFIIASDKKRFSPDVLHPRLHGRRDIVNAAIDWAEELLTPYAHLIDMVGCGNHETSIEKHCSLDPVSILVNRLQQSLPTKHKDHLIHHGGFCGFIDYRFKYDEPNPDEVRRGNKRWVVYYHHGSGGNAPVTKGLIDFNRRDTYVDADVIWLGHKHNKLSVHARKLFCPLTSKSIGVREVRHIMTGAYFDTYRTQSQDSIKEHGRRSNYAADAGMAPQGKGAVRVELHFGPANKNYQMRVIQ